MKYKIKDENNNEFEIEEVVDTDETIVEETTATDEGTLTPEEIAVLKLLAAKANELLGCLKPTETTDTDTTNEDKEDEKEETVGDSCKDEDETKESEEVKEEIKQANDSKAAFGSIGTKDSKKIVNDADVQAEIVNAWANRCKK